jgi:PIN domain nuclease of toxin-antitoxin system
MNYLVGTRYLVWSLLEPERIASGHRAILEDSAHTKYVSSVSFWEIALKFGLGKLRLSGVTPEQLVAGGMRLRTEGNAKLSTLHPPSFSSTSKSGSAQSE